MGLEYRKLSEEDRNYWTEKAREDKRRYDIELHKYRQKINDLANNGVGNFSHNTSTILPGTDVLGAKPKKGKSSYNLYFKAMNDKVKAENPEVTFGELVCAI